MTLIENSLNDIVLKEHEVESPIVSENAETVLKNRYYAKDKNGKVYEDAKMMYLRVANHLATCETETLRKKIAHKFYEEMASNRFMPNSPCLMNAGRDLGMLFACFVLPVEDDLKSIMKTTADIAVIQKAGGGTGMSFSKLRPSGAVVASSGGNSSGPLPFISMMSGTTEAIQQGSFRRGANMGILNVTHPDIVDFINFKQDLKEWQNYNVSVAITDSWMNDLLSGSLGQHVVFHDKWGTGSLWKNKKTGKVVAIKEEPHQVHNTTDFVEWTCEDTWKLISERAHSTGEPGLFFIDKANADNVVKQLGNYESTNPCGEQPLLPYDSCVLGSINLTKFYNPGIIGDFDWSNLKRTIQVAVRFLDNSITVNKYPIPEIENMAKNIRRIGLGIMGFADLLFQMRIPYDSQEGRDLGKEISNFLRVESEKASQLLGEEKGHFPAWKDSSVGVARRNAFTTTVAPTGTISIIANCSGGIEPLFALSFKRQVMPDNNGDFTTMVEVNPHFRKAISCFDEKLRHIILSYVEEHGSLHGFQYGQDRFDVANSELGIRLHELKQIFITSHEITPANHVKMQAALQTHIDSAISKTINLPKESTPKDVAEIYELAYKLSCKGVTVYRDGCRDNVEGMKQPMALEKEKTQDIEALIPEKIEKISESGKPSSKKTFKNVSKFEFKTQFGTMHVFVVLGEDDKPIEVFTQIGKSADMVMADLEAMCRLISIMLQAGIPLDTAIDQLYGIGSNQVAPGPNGKIYSLPDALGKALIYWRENYSKTEDTKKNSVSNSASSNFDSNYGMPCPSCPNGKMTYSEGCKTCYSCGYSAC